ncbi:MFS transporter [Halolamina salifodinae]|uniref:MFS family permease n=1 Tax=Halolamina salifodinae TaxID=1202767 RepID=A0A8T4GYA8_9EURY|nr:MFS transporter [Halolamina salifodinae]MBP1986534.1 MFS family permease [Halolamina salifodinae]
MDGNDRRIVGLTGTAHALLHTYELSVPILVVIWLTEFATNPAELGIVVSVGMALLGLGALPGGVLADRYGSRKLIALCLVGMGGSFLVLSVAPAAATGALGTLPILSVSPAVIAIAVALVLWGAAASVYHPAGLTLISTGVSEQGRGFALHGMAGNIGIAAGPLATTIMLAFIDWETVTAILAIPAFIAAVAALWIDVDEREPDEDDDEETPDSIREFLAVSKTVVHSAFAFVFLVVALNGLYYRGVLTFLPDLLAGLETFQPLEIAGKQQEPANYVYSGLLAVGILGQYAGGRLTDMMSPARGIAYAFGGLSVLALVFLPLASMGAAPLLAVSAVLGFALFIVQPMYQAAVAEYTPEAARGLSYGYTYLGNFGIGALGAGMAGTILTYSNQTVLFLVFAVIAACASGIGLLLMRR